MKKNRKILLSLILLVLGLSLVMFYFPNAKAQTSDIDYDFEANTLYSASNPTPDTYGNVDNQTEFTQTFNGTYSFTDDTDYGDPAGWSIDSEAGGSINVFPSYTTHDKVLEFNDTDGGANIVATQTFTAGVQTSGTVEFWFIDNDADKESYLYLRDDVATVVRIAQYSDGFYYNEGGGWVKFADAVDDTWYHIRYDFECGALGYMGLAADSYYVYLNGERFGAYDFDNPTADIHLFYSQSSVGAIHKYYIDAVSYSWDADYSIGDNVIPYSYENETLQTTEWSFDIDESGVYTTHNQQDVPFWTETGAHNDQIWMVRNSAPSLDGSAVYIGNVNADVLGLEHEFDVATRSNIEVYFRIYHDDFDPDAVSYEYFEVFSYDDTLIVRLRWDDVAVKDDYRLSYYDGASYNELMDVSDTVNHVYAFNITLTDNIVRLIVNESNTFYFPSIVENKDGLGLVRVDTNLAGVSANANGLHIDSIQVNVDGVSYCDDFAVAYYYMGNYDTETYNLLALDASGVFSCSVSSLTDTDTYSYFQLINVSGTTILNSYGSSETIDNAYLSLFYTNTYSITSISVSGIQLTDGTNDYVATYSTSNIVSNISYFYLSGTNTLSYFLNCDDNNTEYININFDINNIATYNRSFLYTGYNYNLFERELRLNYADSTTSIFDVPYGFRTERVYLPEKSFDSLTIEITDDDAQDSYNASGYFTNLIIRSSGEHAISIATSNLLTALIPLLFVILFPALIITYSVKRTSLDDNIRKQMILPLLAVFTIVAFWFAEIDLWMLFLILLGFGTIFYLKRGDS